MERDLINCALHKPATQSSVSQWSAGRTPEEDAAHGNNGGIHGSGMIHTASESQPWWQVDLGAVFDIGTVRLYNRPDVPERLRRFSMLASLDGERWHVFHRKEDDAVFGANGQPYVAEPGVPVASRFVRIRLDGVGWLHFRQCEVFGVPSRADHPALAAPAGPSERDGTLRRIGGFSVAIDRQRYSRIMIEVLENGFYELRERNVINAVLRPGDRVLEAGTAIGVVSMTAAAIVGDENVLTFEANPEIAADAQANFVRNGMPRINAQVGVLKNRRAMRHSAATETFYIARDFWASRLGGSLADGDIIGTVAVAAVCFEDAIAAHRADVFVCDIEGGEVALLDGADLSPIRTIILETHYWPAGREATNALIRALLATGFDLDMDHAAEHLLVLRRR